LSAGADENWIKERYVSDSKILVVPADLAKKIDDNRGDMSRGEFIEALIDNLVVEKTEPKNNNTEYATRVELQVFEQDMKQLLKSFLDFFVSYGLELGENGQQLEIEKFTSKLQGLQKDLGVVDSGKGGGKATIKWKPN
jgi:metal-responsive CopG/Arc/MetJ family transcriptional regulator